MNVIIIMIIIICFCSNDDDETFSFYQKSNIILTLLKKFLKTSNKKSFNRKIQNSIIILCVSQILQVLCFVWIFFIHTKQMKKWFRFLLLFSYSKYYSNEEEEEEANFFQCIFGGALQKQNFSFVGIFVFLTPKEKKARQIYPP